MRGKFIVLLALLAIAGCDAGTMDSSLWDVRSVVNYADPGNPLFHGPTIATPASTSSAQPSAPQSSYTIYPVIGSQEGVLSYPSDMVLDKDHNLFIADRGSHQVYKLDNQGNMRAYAGLVSNNGTPIYGYNGATEALKSSLYGPTSLALDALGTLYVADTFNNRIRKVTSDGKISDFAGTGASDFSGDEGVATAAGLKLPLGLLFDPAGNLLFTDSGNHRMRRVDLAGKVSTVAGTGVQGYAGDNLSKNTALLNSPAGMAFDLQGNLYFADRDNNRVRKIDLSGNITTVAGNGSDSGELGDGGSATLASLSHPQDVAVDKYGFLYIADTYHHRIRRVDLAGKITTIAGGSLSDSLGDLGLATMARLSYPSGITLDSDGGVYIADSGNHRIRILK